MNKIKYLLLGMLAVLIWACDSSDSDSQELAFTETEVSEAPVWQMDWTNNQEKPNWTEPDESVYENSTILKVQIDKTLKPYASEGDMLAIFVNGELRGMTTPVQTLSGQKELGKFLLKVWGNESGTETVNMSLSYYSQTLKHIFTLSDNINLDSDVTTGIDEDFIPEFTYGSAKYPVVKTVGVENILKKVGITPIGNGMMGAFVGEECRGTATLSTSSNTQLLIYGRNASESLTLKYYDVTTGKLYTIPDAVTM